jgi:hypothetical protein
VFTLDRFHCISKSLTEVSSYNLLIMTNLYFLAHLVKGQVYF